MDDSMPSYRVAILFMALAMGIVFAVLMAANASMADMPSDAPGVEPTTQRQQSINDRENLLIRAQDRSLGDMR
jgi:hypothetical protein